MPHGDNAIVCFLIYFKGTLYMKKLKILGKALVFVLPLMLFHSGYAACTIVPADGGSCSSSCHSFGVKCPDDPTKECRKCCCD